MPVTHQMIGCPWIRFLGESFVIALCKANPMAKMIEAIIAAMEIAESRSIIATVGLGIMAFIDELIIIPGWGLVTDFQRLSPVCQLNYHRCVRIIPVLFELSRFFGCDQNSPSIRDNWLYLIALVCGCPNENGTCTLILCASTLAA